MKRKTKWWSVAVGGLGIVVLWSVWLVYGWGRTAELPEGLGSVEVRAGYERFIEATRSDEEQGVAEGNGMREIVAAFGPIALGESTMGVTRKKRGVPLVKRVLWDDFRSDEQGSEWLENVWIPVCKVFGINFTDRPIGMGFRPLAEYLQFRGVTGEEPPLSPEALAEELRNYQNVGGSGKTDVRFPDDLTLRLSFSDALDVCRRLQSAPWTAQDAPMAARWLAEVSPYLDLWNTSVRKPCYTFGEWTIQRGLSGNDSTLGLHLFHRELVRAMEARIQFRLAGTNPGDPEVDAAIDDLMTLFLVNQQIQKEPIGTSYQMIGNATEVAAHVTLLGMLRTNRLSSEQLGRLADQLAALSPPASPESTMELDELQLQEFLYRISDGNTDAWDSLPLLDEVTRLMRERRYDTEIVQRELHERFVKLQAILQEPDTAKRHERFRNLVEDVVARNQSKEGMEYLKSRMGQILSLQRRSEVVADRLFSWKISDYYGGITLAERTESQRNLIGIGVALERYRIVHQRYPETLESLAETGELAAIPRDPQTGLEYVYRPEPFAPLSQTAGEVGTTGKAAESTAGEMEKSVEYTLYKNAQSSPYLLYGFGVNGVDETTQPAILEPGITYSNEIGGDDLRL